MLLFERFGKIKLAKILFLSYMTIYCLTELLQTNRWTCTHPFTKQTLSRVQQTFEKRFYVGPMYIISLIS